MSDWTSQILGETEQIHTSVDKAIEIVTLHGLNVVAAVLILIVGWTAARWVQKIIFKGMEKAKLDETLGRFVSSLARYIVIAFTVIAVLSKFGVQTTSLVALLGAAGLAIGLALQGTLSNVASGVMLLVFRPFKIGEFIMTGSDSGTVQEIGLFFSIINTPDNVYTVIPNSQLWDNAIKNYSRNKTRRVDILVGIGYDDNIDTALKVMDDILKADKRVKTTPAAPRTMVMNLGESSVDLNMRFWCKSSDYWDLKFEVTKTVKEAFDKEGISIPFPHRTLQIVTGNAEVITQPNKK